MLNKTKRLLGAGGAAAIVLLILATAAHAQSAMLMLGNKTPFTIQFYIDGQPACSAAPDTYCRFQTSAGAKAVSAKRTDAELMVCEAKVEVPDDPYIWVCEVPG